MPETLVSHWGLYGEPNGYSSKFVGLFLMPIISLVMYVLFLVLPHVDPMKENVKEFRKYYDLFIVAMVGFLFYLYVLTIAWNLGATFNMVQFLVPAFALLFYFIGTMLEKSKRNWFMGIRTPWTLSSDEVWEKTHKQGSKLFKLTGFVGLLGIVFPEQAFFLVIVPVLLTSFYLLVYSYFVYKNVGNNK